MGKWLHLGTIFPAMRNHKYLEILESRAEEEANWISSRLAMIAFLSFDVGNIYKNKNQYCRKGELRTTQSFPFVYKSEIARK